jgi:hypothetical protein
MPYFVGHTSLDGWYQAIDVELQIYAAMLIESRPGQFSRTERHVVTLSQPVDDEVHYCRIIVGVTEWIGDTCVNEMPRREVREAHARQAWDLVKAWIKQKHLQWHEASVAVPNDVRDGLLEGHAEFLETFFTEKRKELAPLRVPVEKH